MLALNLDQSPWRTVKSNNCQARFTFSLASVLGNEIRSMRKLLSYGKKMILKITKFLIKAWVSFEILKEA